MLILLKQVHYGHIFKTSGRPNEKNLYLFNGDIVDKGKRSFECILLLFVYKLLYPDFVFLNRGNHECATLNMKHGFRKEINLKYGRSRGKEVGGPATPTPDDYFMFEFFGQIFQWMPIAHLINSEILVVHGGLSASSNLTIEDIRNTR